MVSTTNTSLDVGADEVFDEMTMNKFLKRECTVDEYYAYYTSSVSNKDWSELYRSGLFVFGLQSEIGKRVEMFNPKSLSDAYHLALSQERTNNLMKGKTKASFFHTSCVKDSREVMDEVDGKMFVENGFKLNKIDESQVSVHCRNDSIMDFDKVCEEARKSSELESNVSSKVDVDGMVNCEEDGEDHEFESSEVVDNNIDLKNLVEVSKKGDKDEEMSSKDLSGVEDNNICFVEMTTKVANIKDLVNGVPGMEIDSHRNGDSNYDAMGVNDVVINSSKEDVNSNFKEVKNRKEHDGNDNEVKSSGVVINNFGLKVLDIPCEEKVEGIGMKSKEFFELDDKNMSMESKIIDGRMIQDDSKFKVPPDVDPKSIVCEFFKVGQCAKGTMEDWDLETLEKFVESKEKEYNQNKPTNIKTTTPMITDFFTGWKKKKMDEKRVVKDSHRAERTKNDRMSGRELFLADASLFLDDAEAYEKCHREEKPDNSNQESQESSSMIGPSTSTSVAVVYEEGNFDIDDVKLYHLRRWIKDLGKETKGFTHVVSQFDMWKWPTRKKIDGTQCKVKLRKWKEREVTEMCTLTACDEAGIIFVEPQTLMARRMKKKGNNDMVYVLIQWSDGSIEVATWEPVEDIMKRFPQFQLILEDKYHFKRNGFICDKIVEHVQGIENKAKMQQQFDCCEVCEGPHYSFDCQTRNQLVYEPNSSNNYDFPCFDQPPQYHIDSSPPQDLDSHSHCMLLARENNRILEEILSIHMPNSPVVPKELERSDDYTEVTLDEEQCLCDHYTAPVTHPPLAYTPPSPVLATMEPLDTFLMRDEVISTILAREINEFIKSSVDDLVPILRESELTLDSIDLECSMPIDPPLPCTDVLRDAKVDIDLPFGEHLDTLSTWDREIDFNPIKDIEELERLLADEPVPVPKVFDAPLGNSDSVPRSYDVTFSNPLFDFNDDYTLCYDNPLFDEELKDIIEGDDEGDGDLFSSFDPFVEIPSSESKVHIEVLSVLWGNRLPISDGSLPLSRMPDVSVFKKVEEITEVEIRLLALSVRTPDVSVV
ncbi:NAC domain-containing protein [Tanacetum coccineum]